MFITVTAATAFVSIAINVVAVGYGGRVVVRYAEDKFTDLQLWYRTFKEEYERSIPAREKSRDATGTDVRSRSTEI